MTPSNSEWERELDEELNFLSQDGYAYGWRKMKTDAIKEIFSRELARAREEGRREGYEAGHWNGRHAPNSEPPAL